VLNLLSHVAGTHHHLSDAEATQLLKDPLKKGLTSYIR
jgi:hypothetical protein